MCFLFVQQGALPTTKKGRDREREGERDYAGLFSCSLELTWKSKLKVKTIMTSDTTDSCVITNDAIVTGVMFFLILLYPKYTFYY